MIAYVDPVSLKTTQDSLGINRVTDSFTLNIIDDDEAKSFILDIEGLGEFKLFSAPFIRV